MAGSPHPLQEERDSPRAPELHHQVHRTDVDAQLERGSGDHRPQLAPLELLLGREPELARHASVVRRHRPRPETVAEVMGDALSELAGVGEDERRPVLGGELHQPVVDLAPHLVGGDGAQVVLRRLERQLPPSEMADLHHGASLGTTGEKGGECLHRFLGCREADQLRTTANLRLEPLEREGQMAPTLVPGEGVNLVHDDRLHVPERLATPGRGEDQVEGLGRGDEDVRRAAEHLRPLAGRRVASPHLDADGLGRETFPGRELVDGLERTEQVLLHVVAERLERGRRTPRDVRSSRRLSSASRSNRSSAARNAESVLPEPVGAAMSTSSPARMRGQPRLCGSEGVPSADRNQRCTSGWKSPSAGWTASAADANWNGSCGAAMPAFLNAGAVRVKSYPKRPGWTRFPPSQAVPDTSLRRCQTPRYQSTPGETRRCSAPVPPRDRVLRSPRVMARSPQKR